MELKVTKSNGTTETLTGVKIITYTDSNGNLHVILNPERVVTYGSGIVSGTQVISG